MDFARNILYGNGTNQGVNVYRGYLNVDRNIFLNFGTAIKVNQESGISSTANIRNNIIAGADYAIDSVIYYLTEFKYHYIENNLIYDVTNNSTTTAVGIKTGYSGYSSFTADDARFYIRNNTFQNIEATQTGAKIIDIKMRSNDDYYFDNNNFLDLNVDYIFHTVRNFSYADLAITNTWFGSSNTADIDALLFDGNDNVDYHDLDYTGYLSAPSTTTPISVPTGLTLTDLGSGSIQLDWNANPESDLQGYRIYYDQDGEYPYTGGSGLTSSSSAVVPGDSLGDVLSVQIDGLTSGTWYFTLSAYDSSYDGTDDLTDGNESFMIEPVSITIP